MEAESFWQRWLEKAHAERSKVDTKMESKDEDRNGPGTREPVQGDSVYPKKKKGGAKKGLQDVGAGSKSRSQGGRNGDPGSTGCQSDNRRGFSETMGLQSCRHPPFMESPCRALGAAMPLAYSRSGDFQVFTRNVLIAKVIIRL